MSNLQATLPEPLVAAPADDVEPRGWRAALAELRRSRKGMAGAAVVLFMLLAAIVGPFVYPHSPTDQSVALAHASPTWSHPFGCDELGRDVLARVLSGARVSLAIGLLVVSITAVVGSLLGAIAGYAGGAVDQVIMRLTDFQLSFPFIVLAFVFLAILGPGFWSIVAALAAALWVNYARVVRAEALRLRGVDFVQASRTFGARHRRVLGRHILPNTFASVIVLATLDVGFVIVFEASLTFLGLGIQPPTPTWGGMIASGQEFLSINMWMTLFPAAALILTVLGINLLGDWLRDAFDPSLKGR